MCGFDVLHGGLYCLECVCGLRVCVFVGVQLNRQFAVKLGEEVLLHLNHACKEHVLGCGQDLVDHEGLFLCDRCFRVLTQKLVSKSARSLINLLLTSLML